MRVLKIKKKDVQAHLICNRLFKLVLLKRIKITKKFENNIKNNENSTINIWSKLITKEINMLDRL